MNNDYCLWMGEIDPEMDEYTIQNFFQFYNVFPLSVKLIKDKETNQNKNYCFIYFKNIYEANNTLNLLNGKPIPNTSLSFKLNWANYHVPTIKKIYIRNLNPSIDEKSLFDFFKSKYKSVTKVKIITNNGQSKRYGFVTFKKENDYRKSLIEMNGVFFEGTNIKVKEYKKKDEEENSKNNENKNQNLKNNNTNYQLELNNEIKNNNNDRQLNTNNLNSNSFLTISNTINKLNWVSNANPINGVNIGINHIDDVNINIHSNLFNQNTLNSNYDEKNININFNNNECLKIINGEIECSKDNNNLNNSSVNNVNNINNVNENNNLINIEISESKINKNPKLEILEELDEITLKIKINESLNKMLEYYKESYLINGNRVISKLILYLMFL